MLGLVTWSVGAWIMISQIMVSGCLEYLECRQHESGRLAVESSLEGGPRSNAKCNAMTIANAGKLFPGSSGK